MSFTYTAKDRAGSDHLVSVSNWPDECPRCHRSVHVRPLFVAKSDKRLQAVFRCSAESCDELFISTHDFRPINGTYQFTGSAPTSRRVTTFPESVENVSPSFVTIYNQAMAAEGEGFDQLVGIGLRKSLEFLIKDFSSAQHPEKAEKIKAMNLGPCIDVYVTDANVKECAKRAAWLGNDETHYVRKWEARDISDLKLLVRLTSNWIDNILLTRQYVAEMQPPTA